MVFECYRPGRFSRIGTLSFGVALFFLFEVFGDGDFLVVDVLLHESLGADDIAELDGFEDAFVFVDEGAAFCLVLDVFKAVAVHLFAEVVDHLNELCIAGGCVNDVVIGFIGFGDFHLRGAGCDYFFKVVFGILQFLQLFVGDPLTGEVSRKLLEGTTDLEHILEASL